jgi:hypothetical protein
MVDSLFQVARARALFHRSVTIVQASVQGVVDATQRQLDAILREGYSPSQIIAQLLSSVLAAGGGSLSELQRGKLLVQLSEVDRRITEVPRAAAFIRMQH